MAQRIFRSDDTSRYTVKYGTGAQGSRVYAASKVLDSADFYFNGAITGNVDENTGPVTNIPDGVYNLPCKIEQSAGVGSNEIPNYELNFLISVTGGVATFKYDFTKTWNAGAQIVTSGNWINVTTNNFVTLSVPAYNPTLGYGGLWFMVGKGKFLQVGSGVVDLRYKGFPGGPRHQNAGDRDYGGYGGYGAAGRSGKGGFSGNGGNGTVAGDFPSGGSRDRDGAESSHGAAGGQNYTGGGGGGGANQAQQDESAGGGGGGGNKFGGGGGGDGTDSNGPGGNGGAATGLGGGAGGGYPSAGADLAGGPSGDAYSTPNYSGHGGDGNPGAGRNGGGGGGGADANADSQLRAMHMGGGGGGGGNYNRNSSTDEGGDGGYGGGNSLTMFPQITLTGGFYTSGTNGLITNISGGGGGGGAAGDQRFVGVKVDLGNGCNAQGGIGGQPGHGGDGGNGSEAIIHVDYAGTLTGTTAPTVSSRQDKTLVPVPAGAALLMLLRLLG